MKVLTAVLFAGIVVAGAKPATSAVFHLNDQNSYELAAVDAQEIILPNLGSVVSNTFQAGGLTFGTTAPRGILSGTGGSAQWSTLLEGPEIAISGVEDFGIAGERLKSISFEIHEPNVSGSQTNFTDTCNATCVTSAFRVTVFANGSAIDAIEFGLGGNAITFLGITSDTPFDSILVNEVFGTADNEFFGNFTSSTFDQPSEIPFRQVWRLGQWDWRYC